MDTPLLAACLIVKNEEANILGCLESLSALRPVLEEICVYDTGSTDGTVELALERGARVEQGYWNDDFARARNAALAMTQAKWVLSIDADERVNGSVRRLGAALREGLTANLTGYDTLSAWVVSLDADSRPMHENIFPRLLRPSRTKWRNKLHEVPRRFDGSTPSNLRLDMNVLHYLHYGYSDKEVMVRKAARNIDAIEGESDRLEELTLEERARVLVDRARSYSLTGDTPTTVECLEQARLLRTSSVHRRWAGELLSDIYSQLGRYEEANRLRREVLSEGSSRDYCDWLAAQSYVREERFAEAVPLLRRLGDVKDSGGLRTDAAPMVQARLIAEARCRNLDEALACCLHLMAGLGLVEGLGGTLLALWGGRPPAALAELIASVGHGHDEAVAAELRTCRGAGAEVAIYLTLRDWRGSSSAQAKKALLPMPGGGASFGPIVDIR